MPCRLALFQVGNKLFEQDIELVRVINEERVPGIIEHPEVTIERVDGAHGEQ